MHSSRMRTARCSGCRGDVSQHALGSGVYVYPSMHWAAGYVCIPACTGQGVSAQGVSALDVSAQGRCLPGAVCYGGVCLEVSVRGVCLGGVYPGGVSARGCLPWGCLGVYLGGVCLGGVCLGGCLPHPLPADTHTPVNRITDACENITLPQLRCGQ